jgi:hypothetical protein
MEHSTTTLDIRSFLFCNFLGGDGKRNHGSFKRMMIATFYWHFKQTFTVNIQIVRGFVFFSCTLSCIYRRKLYLREILITAHIFYESRIGKHVCNLLKSKNQAYYMNIQIQIRRVHKKPFTRQMLLSLDRHRQK